MTATTLFYIIIGILSFSFLLERIIGHLNAKHYNDTLSEEIKDIYNDVEYKNTQNYKALNYKFSLLTSTFTFVTTLSFIIYNGFSYIDHIARQYSQNPIIIALIFFGIIALGNTLINIPFSYYSTFVIEERFGFNKTSKKTFVLDKIKGLIITAIAGGALLALVIWIYLTVQYFWIYAWGLITIVSLLINMFYSKLIVPLFNKQTALPQGNLRDGISKYTQSVGFEIDKIYVIDGSKRSTKANAYFSGFGSEKRVTLYDTLINNLNEEEVIAVLAHEVGHYKRRHIIYNIITSTLLTGLTLFLFALFVSNAVLSQALGVSKHSFHIGLIAFGILYTPFSEITGLIMNFISRAFEYQADNYAKNTYKATPLITALKKLSKNSMSNLTPHKAHVFLNYSHPTLLQRIKNLNKNT